MNSKRIDQLMEQYFRGTTTKGQEQELKGLFDSGTAGKNYPAERKMLNGIEALQMQASLRRVEFKPGRRRMKLNIHNAKFRNTVLALSVTLIGVVSYSVGAYQYKKDIAKIRELSSQSQVINHAILKLNQGLQQSGATQNGQLVTDKQAQATTATNSVWDYPGKIYRKITGSK